MELTSSILQKLLLVLRSSVLGLPLVSSFAATGGSWGPGEQKERY